MTPLMPMMCKVSRIAVALGLAGLLFPSVGLAGQAHEKKPPKNSDIEKIGNRDINKGSLNFYSYDREIEMGRELAAQVVQAAKLFDDKTINEYVNCVGQNLV